MSSQRFRNYAWGLLAYSLVVVLWGAYVRASLSGDGCGDHWPKCGGEFIPRLDRMATLVEYTHRLTSGLLIPLCLALLIWARRLYPKGHPVRAGALWAFLFTMAEALIGAGLVIFKLVANNQSAPRAVVMPAHLVATFLLSASITLTAWWAGVGKPLQLRGQGPLGWAFGVGLLSTLLLSMTGALNALGDTLFPAGSLIEGIQRDFLSTSHFLERVRPVHPLLAAAVSLYLILIAGMATHLRPSPHVRLFARWMGVLFIAQLGIGLLNLLMLAPIWMQIIHLGMAVMVWNSLVLLTASALAEGVPQVELASARQMGVPIVEGATLGTATWSDYLALTKPRVISLLLFTTVTAMIIAAGGWPGTGLFLATSIGLYMAAGAANAINMVLERDLDLRMKRTATRPTVTQKITSRHALGFAFGLALGSFVLLWSAATLLSALMALSGLVCYVVVYTLALKRRTWTNIVIGGAAGAFPPLVGWAAVTGDLSRLAWCLFAIIVVWTPVHFWALALLIKEDYAEAGVPMLPVVRGDRATVFQIAVYAVLTVAISFVPALWGVVGWPYVVAAGLLNLVLMWRSMQLYQKPDRPRASSLFHYSMLYLALLFLAMAVDRAHWV